jgi:hypothetical protein
MTAGVGLSASSIASTAAPMIRALPKARQQPKSVPANGIWVLQTAANGKPVLTESCQAYPASPRRVT